MDRQPILRKLTERCGLSAEPLPGNVLVELNGDDRVLIENHDHIIGYHHAEVLISVKYGSVKVCGSDLVIACIEPDRLLIRGRIDSVILLRGGAT